MYANKVKKIAAVHDLSGMGRVSLTVVIPILSSMGFQVCPLPTAVLSNHTQYPDFSFLDLTDEMPKIIAQWKKLNSSFSLLLGNKKRLPSPYSQFSSSYYMPDPYTNINRDLLNRWKEPGDEAHTIIPSLPKGNMSLIQLPNGESTFKIPVWEQSDAMVVSGSFLRCRNIGLSWQMKREWCEKIYMKNLSLNFNMDNIFVIASKRFNGFDPEISNSVLPRNYSLGINIGF